jgi:Holliday junction resolvasome RuvABC endonuclease subunit
MALVLGIDQSYTSCGYVLWNTESQQMEEFGRFTTEKTDTTYARALSTAKKICELIKKHNPTMLKAEGLAFGIRGDATRDLAGLLFTIVNLVAYEHPTIVFKEYAPTSVKKKATGSGKADKKAMIEALSDDVRQKFLDAGFKKTTGLTDLTDAYWIARMPD